MLEQKEAWVIYELVQNSPGFKSSFACGDNYNMDSTRPVRSCRMSGGLAASLLSQTHGGFRSNAVGYGAGLSKAEQHRSDTARVTSGHERAFIERS